MILTVTLNAAIDKTVTVPNFRIGRRHRSVAQQAMAGGKGINVARALKRLGRPVIATGLAGGATGTRIVEALTAESILNDFVRIQEESRTNTSVLDPTTGEQTEINERGPRVAAAEIATFRDKLLYLARGAAVVVFAGSLPRGVDPSIYAELVEELKGMGLLCVVDADGEPLRLAVKAAPDLVTPNVVEAEELVGHEFSDERDLLAAVGEIVELGAREAIITRSDGAVAQLQVEGKPVRLRARIAEREPVAPVGSGDAFLAGYVAARYDGAAPEECLGLAVASGADSLARMGAGVVEAKEVERLRNEVTVERVDGSARNAPVGSSGTMRRWR